MSIPSKSGLTASLTAVTAACLLLVAGSAVAGQSNMSNQSMSDSSSSSQSMRKSNRFGGPVYNGKPALPVTVALVKAGGGASDFSLVTALNNMLGKKTVKSEVGKLTKQYGKDRVHNWVKVMDFYINDTLKIVNKKGIKLPAPADLSGTDLAKALVKAGTASDGTFWAGDLFDHAVSHPIHVQLMNDADSMYNGQQDGNAHAITNQAFYDVAQALGMNNVKLAPYHS